jgi:hypothetical protein
MNASISSKRLKELERAEAKLRALEFGGVDNWEFYDECLTAYNNQIEAEEKLETLLEELEVTFLEGAYEPSERGAGYATTDEARNTAMGLLKDYIKEYIESNDKA